MRIAVYVHRHLRVRGDQRGLRELLPEPTRPRATTIGVAALPLGAEVEIDAVIALPLMPTTVTDADVRAARAAVERLARRTPMLSTRTFSERAGGTSRSRRRTCSARARSRSAASRPSSPRSGDAGCATGVVAASAGNHAQARRRGRRRARRPVRGLRARRRADGQGRGGARAWARSVHVGGDSVDACLVAALERAEAGRAGVRPPVRRPGDRRRAGHARPRAARGRAGPGQGRRPGRRRRAVRRRRASRSRPRSPRSRSSASRRRRARPTRSRCGAATPIEADVGADDRRRHRGQAARAA